MGVVLQVERFGSSSGTYYKLDHITCWNVFCFHFSAFWFMSIVAVNWYTFHVYTVYNDMMCSRICSTADLSQTLGIRSCCVGFKMFYQSENNEIWIKECRYKLMYSVITLLMDRHGNLWTECKIWGETFVRYMKGDYPKI